MNFLNIQSLNTYTKNMEMQLKWQKKKSTNDFTADGSTTLTDPTAQQAEAIRQAQADGTAKLSSQIRTKLATGKKLTQEEMEYLQKHDPQTYQQVKSLEAEQKGYEEKLKRCKTKEEVQQVKTDRVAASLSVVNSVANNPAIPESAKLGIAWQELQKNMALEETIQEFVESDRYAQLPTKAEKLEAEKDLKEAKEAELGIEDPTRNQEDKVSAEQADRTEPADDKKSESETDFHSTIKEPAAQETSGKSDAVLQEHTLLEPPRRGMHYGIPERYKMSRTEAETTPEALKVKRARAQAAYRSHQVEIPAPVMDLKAE